MKVVGKRVGSQEVRESVYKISSNRNSKTTTAILKSLTHE